MNFKLEIPQDMLLISQDDLREVMQQLFLQIQEEHEKEEIMTIREVAEYLKVSVPTIRAMIANREIPFFQRGQVIRLNRRDVVVWLRNQCK